MSKRKGNQQKRRAGLFASIGLAQSCTVYRALNYHALGDAEKAQYNT